MAKKKEFGTVVDDTIQQAEDIREVQRSADRAGEEQQQLAAQQEQQAPSATQATTVPEASASGNTADTAEKPNTTAPSKLTKLTGQGVTQLVITDAYKKHTITMYEPLYQLMNAMAKAWNTNLQDVAALVMMLGVRDLKGKDRAKINRLIKSFVSEDTDKEIEDMRTAYLREHTAAHIAQAGLTPNDIKAILAQAGLTPDDLKALANGES